MLVTRIDRLSRSTFDLFTILKTVTEVGARFRCIEQPEADTGSRFGELILPVLGWLGRTELDLIKTRTAEGRARAKARGQHMGRPPALTPGQAAEARQRRADGATLTELAASYNVGRATISRLGT